MGGTVDDTYAKIADLTDTKSVKSLIENVEGALGAIDIVINNAGMVQTGREEPSVLFHETSDEKLAIRNRYQSNKFISCY